MTKGAAIIAAILILLTGLVLGQIGVLAMHSGVSDLAEPNPSPRALATARSFYEALDRLLDSGDRSVESTVGPGFVDHPLSGQDDRTLQETIDGLLALRTTWPHLRLTVLDLEQRDQLIVVRLEIDPGEPSPIPGVPLRQLQPYQVLELLRVEGAGVTERWTADGQLAATTFQMQTDVRWDSSALVIPAIEHVVLDPGHTTQLPHGGTIALWTELGSVQLDRVGVDLDGIRRALQEPLVAGQVRIMDGDGPVIVRNMSSSPAELWAFSTDAGHTNQDTPEAAAPDSAQPRTVAFLPLQLSSHLRGVHLRMSITRISLPAGASVASHDPGVIEEIAVLDGALDVTVERGRALVCMDGATAQPFDDTVTLAAGQGVSANELASLSYRVAGSNPATLLIVRIEAPRI